ncbi:Longitudinals lacking protein, isoform G [Anthophora quadrimaculata]
MIAISNVTCLTVILWLIADFTKMKFYVSRMPKEQRRSRGQGRFACDNCDRRYHQMKNLRRHMINECGKQPMHQCVFCPYRATYRSYLQVHMMKHTRSGFTPRTPTIKQYRNE